MFIIIIIVIIIAAAATTQLLIYEPQLLFANIKQNPPAYTRRHRYTFGLSVRRYYSHRRIPWRHCFITYSSNDCQKL